MKTGRIHSFQSMGAVDGPGVRYVVFLQGCPLRCCYCHNPDTWEQTGGEEYTTDAVMEKILRYRSYFGEQGGVTVSGGEPLLQWEFVKELFEKLQKEGIHTALDTSAHGSLAGAGQVLEHTNLVLCDVKFTTEEAYRKHCGGSLETVQKFLMLCEEKKIPTWIRHVVVPGMTDSEAEIGQLTELIKPYSCVKKIELLPFHKLCVEKYQKMKLVFPLADTPECDRETIERLYRMIEK